MNWLITIVLVGAALLEVFGDAVIRTGLRGQRPIVLLAGCLLLSGYGVMVNLVRWDFSRLLGAYVAVFAVAGVGWGRFVFHEEIPLAGWIGLGLIVAGGLLIQFGTRY